MLLRLLLSDKGGLRVNFYEKNDFYQIIIETQVNKNSFDFNCFESQIKIVCQKRKDCCNPCWFWWYKNTHVMFTDQAS